MVVVAREAWAPILVALTGSGTGDAGFRALISTSRHVMGVESRHQVTKGKGAGALVGMVDEAIHGIVGDVDGRFT